jgi:hypothetical protein
MIKDFLFFNYSWVFNSTYIFKSFENSGYSCDFVDEDTLRSFVPYCKYKVVVLYLHEPWSIPITNNLINNYFYDSFLIQHDDTDFENVQVWGDRKPNLIMQREYTDNTHNPYSDVSIYPHHFPIASIYREEYQNKEYDVCFLGAPTNARREFFVRKIKELSSTSLNHLNWFIKYDNNRQHDQFIEILNKSKIALNYFGNSYDAHRIWEAASAKCCIIQPQLPLKSVQKEHMFFDDYIKIKVDCSDLKEKILWALTDDEYKIWAERAFNSYNNDHNPKKCFEKYLEIVLKHCPVLESRVANGL